MNPIATYLVLILIISGYILQIICLQNAVFTNNTFGGMIKIIFRILMFTMLIYSLMCLLYIPIVKGLIYVYLFNIFIYIIGSSTLTLKSIRNTLRSISTSDQMNSVIKELDNLDQRHKSYTIIIGLKIIYLISAMMLAASASIESSYVITFSRLAMLLISANVMLTCLGCSYDKSIIKLIDNDYADDMLIDESNRPNQLDLPIVQLGIFLIPSLAGILLSIFS